MKKFIIASVLLLTLVFVPQSAAAQTSAELQALIASLQAQIMALTAQLEARQGTACMVPTGNAYFGDEDSYGSNNIINLQKFLIKKGYLSMPAGVGYGFFGNLTGVAVNSWHKAADIYERDGNGRAYLGPIGIEIIRASGLCSGTVTPPTGNQSPVITGLTAPTNLKVGETGTWLVKAYDPEGQPLSYNVDWGDVVKVAIDTFPTTNQTTSFTHRYNQAGTYIVNFSVADEKGGIARTSATIVVGDVVSGQGYPQATTTGATLDLSIDDDYGNGVLRAVHNVNIRAVGGDVYIPNFTPFKHTLFLNGNSSNANNSWILTSSASSNEVECPKVGGQCFKIESGTIQNFRASYVWDTRQLFSGVYYHKVTDVVYVTDGDYANASASSSITNKVTVVGERSPYIESVTPTVSVGGTVTIKGPRLCGISGISMSGNTGYAQSMTCTSGAGSDSLTFVVNLKTPPGDYALQLLDNNRGNSNILHFEVTGGTVANPTITVISPNGGESYVSGQDTIVVQWSYLNLNPDPKIKIYLYSPTLSEVVSYNYDQASSSGKDQYSFLIPQAVTTGQYKIGVCDMNTERPDLPGKNVCDLSNDYFTIATPTPDEPAPEPTVAFMTVLNPNGGEKWTIGESRNIRWTTNTVPEEKIRIRLVSVADEDSADEGRIIIDRGVPNSGRYVWTVGKYVGGQLTAGGTYKVKVCTMGTIGETVCDKSDNRFTIKASSAMVNRQVAIVLQSVQGVLNLLNRVVVN